MKKEHQQPATNAVQKESDLLKDSSFADAENTMQISMQQLTLHIDALEKEYPVNLNIQGS